MKGSMVLFIAALVAALPMVGSVKADEIVAYEFTFPGDIDDIFKPTRTDQHITGSEYDFDSDASQVVGWSGSGGNPGAVFYAATTIVSTWSYVFFSLTVENGYTLRFDDLNFDSRRNVHAATTYDAQYSTDGDEFTSLGSGDLTGTSYEAIQADNGGTPISDLTGTIYFRIDGRGWSGAADADQYWYHDNVVVNGLVEELPQTTLTWDADPANNGDWVLNPAKWDPDGPPTADNKAVVEQVAGGGTTGTLTVSTYEGDGGKALAKALDINHGTVDVTHTGQLEITDDVVVGDFGTLQVDGTLTAARVGASGTVSGSGTIEADYIEITGVVSPGSGVGMLTVDGELELIEGTYLCEIDSSGADRLHNANEDEGILLSYEGGGATLELLVLEALAAPGCYTETILSTSGVGVIDGDFPDGQKPAEGHLDYGVFLDGYKTVDTGAGVNYNLNLFQAGHGDTDGDGDVDLDDLSVLDDGWDPTATDKIWTDGDVDGDCDVDLDDLSLLDDAWAPAGYPLVNCGREGAVPLGGPAAVPEPGTLVLLGMAVVGLLAYVWRKHRRR